MPSLNEWSSNIQYSQWLHAITFQHLCKSSLSVLRAQVMNNSCKVTVYERHEAHQQTTQEDTGCCVQVTLLHHHSSMPDTVNHWPQIEQSMMHNTGTDKMKQHIHYLQLKLQQFINVMLHMQPQNEHAVMSFSILNTSCVGKTLPVC